MNRRDSGFTPEFAVDYVRQRLFNRYCPAAVRRSLAYLESLRPRSEALVALEQIIGLVSVMDTQAQAGPGPGAAIQDVKGLSLACYGTALANSREETQALEVIGRALRSFELSTGVRGVLHVRASSAALRCRRFLDAERFANQGEKVFRQGTFKILNPFDCLESALLVRCNVLASSYCFGGADAAVLTRAADDAREVLSSNKSTFVGNAADLLVWVSACQGMSGVDVSSITEPRNSHRSGTMEWAKSKWSKGLLRCAQIRRLEAGTERHFREARDALMALNLVDDVVLITIDLQFWLIASGQPRRAALESAVIRSFLPAVSDVPRESEAIVLWLLEVDERKLSVEVAETVFREVRGIPRVPNLLSLL